MKGDAGWRARGCAGDLMFDSLPGTRNRPKYPLHTEKRTATVAAIHSVIFVPKGDSNPYGREARLILRRRKANADDTLQSVTACSLVTYCFRRAAPGVHQRHSVVV